MNDQILKQFAQRLLIQELGTSPESDDVAAAAMTIYTKLFGSLELALAPAFREDFRETLHRMVAMLTAMRITLLMTVEVVDSYIDLRFSPHGTAFLTDGILLQRYIELEGQLRRLVAVVKLRGSQHSKDLRLYEITNEGLIIGDGLRGYEGLMTGTPKLLPGSPSNKG